jgi:hypothetical protein
MADSPTVDNGALTDYTVAGDDVTVTGMGGSGVVQFMKLVDGTANGVTPVKADGRGLYVAVAPQPAAAATLSNVASSATNVTLLASNASRKGVIIHNDSTQILRVKFGATASSTSYTYKLAADETREFPGNTAMYTGIIDGIWASANGSARLTELT